MNLYDPPAATPAQSRANLALGMPRRMLTQTLNQYNRTLDAIWAAPNPAATLAALGAEGVALFNELAAWRAFLEARKPGCTASRSAARIKPTVLNADGTVTLS
jgi:hypothetical protein